MRHLRGWLVISASLSALAGAAAALVTGCGGDDTQALPEGGHQDAATDGTVEAEPDTGSDAMTSDASDGSEEPGIEAGMDADADASAMLAFPMQVAQAICGRIGACCFGQPDASVFDEALCINEVLATGYQGSSEGTYLFTADGGEPNVVFDSAKAASCLQEINAIDCAANVVTTQQQATLISDCFGALKGTLPVGASCRDAIECAPGEFCQLPTDGGAGVCASLRDAGGPCGDFGAQKASQSEQACSYRGSGDTNLFCHNADLLTGAALDASTWTCMAAQPIDAGCNNDIECASKLCDPGPNFQKYQCTNSLPFAYMGACGAFEVKDAGAD